MNRINLTTVLLAALFLAALPGCGGSNDAQSEQEAGDDWDTTSVNHILESAVFKNDSTSPQTVKVEGGLSWSFPNGIAAKNVVFGWCRPTTDRFADYDSDFSQEIKAGADYPVMSCLQTYTVPPGQTMTFLLVAKESSFVPPVRYRGARITVTKIANSAP